MDKLHVAILMGGWSAERSVSLMSGEGVAAALEERGHSVSRIDMDRNVAMVLNELRPDVIFNALHGCPGEDGSVQGMLDLMQIPYTHSGMITSVIAIDKELTKQCLVPEGVPMPEGKIVESKSLYESDPLPRPYVLKPINEGSSVGVAIVHEGSDFGSPIDPNIKGPWQEFEMLLAEPFIKGRELTCAVLGERALCVTELVPKNGFYDFEAKYTDGMTNHICPAAIPEDIKEYIMELALLSHQKLGCKGVSRTDFRWDDALGKDGVFVLETNTQPGMTPLSLVPEQAKHMGISYGALVEAIIGEALWPDQQ